MAYSFTISLQSVDRIIQQHAFTVTQSELIYYQLSQVEFNELMRDIFRKQKLLCRS